MPRSRSRSMRSKYCSRMSRSRDGPGELKQAVRERALAVVDVGDDGDRPLVCLIHGVQDSWGSAILGGVSNPHLEEQVHHSMANIKSQIKRNRQNESARQRNKSGVLLKTQLATSRRRSAPATRTRPRGVRNRPPPRRSTRPPPRASSTRTRRPTRSPAWPRDSTTSRRSSSRLKPRPRSERPRARARCLGAGLRPSSRHRSVRGPPSP